MKKCSQKHKITTNIIKQTTAFLQEGSCLFVKTKPITLFFLPLSNFIKMISQIGFQENSTNSIFMFFQTTLTLYKNAYGGLPRTSWLLASIMLINRSGSMVIPFMGVYLVQKLHFSLTEAGTIITIFGMGSIVGTYLGGWLADKIGQYHVQFWSLLIGGFGFFVLMFMQTFWEFAVAIFVISIIVEALRPANSASVAQYSAPENLTRSYALNRLAANLGYAVGPSVGGLLAAYDFRYLFLVDAITCISAGLFFRYWFKPTQQKASTENQLAKTEKKLPSQDYDFLIAVGLAMICVTTFFQLFTVMPLYFKQICFYSEQKIGVLLGTNGLIIALAEMLIVYKIGQRVSPIRMISIGALMLVVAFSLIAISKSLIIIVFAIVFFTFGEIFMFPYLNVFTVSRSSPSTRGKFIGIYASVFSIAWVFAPLIGTNVAKNFDFTTLWYLMIAFNVIGFIGFKSLEAKMKIQKL